MSFENPFPARDPLNSRGVNTYSLSHTHRGKYLSTGRSSKQIFASPDPRELAGDYFFGEFFFRRKYKKVGYSCKCNLSQT